MWSLGGLMFAVPDGAGRFEAVDGVPVALGRIESDLEFGAAVTAGLGLGFVEPDVQRLFDGVAGAAVGVHSVVLQADIVRVVADHAVAAGDRLGCLCAPSVLR